MHSRLIAIAIAASIAAGCAVQPSKPQSVGPIDQALVQYDGLLKTGQADKATTLMADIKREYPTRKEPWLKQAQADFDGGNYGQAILDAQETLQRDPADRTAQSIIAVAGLRVSANALVELVRRDGVPGNVRDEAAWVAMSLRESLGANVLVPPPEKPIAAPPPEPVKRKRAPVAPPAKPTASTTNNNSGSSKSPFDALK